MELCASEHPLYYTAQTLVGVWKEICSMYFCGSFGGSVLFVESEPSSGESSGVGHSSAAVLGGVLSVLALVSVFTMALIFGLLSACVHGCMSVWSAEECGGVVEWCVQSSS